jgi:transposase
MAVGRGSALRMCWPTRPYSTRKIRGSLRGKGIRATIPEPANQIAGRKAKGCKGGRPPAFDAELYKQRNTVERAFNKLRETRAVATRYDKRDFRLPGDHRRSLNPNLAPRPGHPPFTGHALVLDGRLELLPA